MNDIKERLEECFALALPAVPRQEIAGAAVNAATGWDSLATVNILSLVEEEFRIQVPDAELENFVSFKRILDYVQSRGNAASN